MILPQMILLSFRTQSLKFGLRPSRAKFCRISVVFRFDVGVSL
jgi:hypothetical protein